MPVGLPLVDSVDFVEGDDEGHLLLLQHVERFDGLRLETMHDVDDEDGNVAETRTTIAQVRERLVTGCVNNQKAG